MQRVPGLDAAQRTMCKVAGDLLLTTAEATLVAGEVPRPALGLIRGAAYLGAVFCRPMAAEEEVTSPFAEWSLLIRALRCDAAVLLAHARVRVVPEGEAPEDRPRPSEDPEAQPVLIMETFRRHHAPILHHVLYNMGDDGKVKFEPRHEGSNTLIEGPSSILWDAVRGLINPSTPAMEWRVAADTMVRLGHVIIISVSEEALDPEGA